MRFMLYTVACTALFIMPVMAAEDPAYTKWDQCVGYNTSDYADMFGAVSIDDEDVTKAIEDCYDAEVAYRAAHPGVPETIIREHKADLKSKWIAVYQNKSHRLAGN